MCSTCAKENGGCSINCNCFCHQPRGPRQCGYCGAEEGKCVTLQGSHVCLEYAVFWTYEAAYLGL